MSAGGDPMRAMGPPFLGAERESAYFLSDDTHRAHGASCCRRRVPGAAVHRALHGVARDPTPRHGRRQSLQRLARGGSRGARPGCGGRSCRPGARLPLDQVVPGAPRSCSASCSCGWRLRASTRAGRPLRVPGRAARHGHRHRRRRLGAPPRRTARHRLALGAVAPTPMRVADAEVVPSRWSFATVDGVAETGPATAAARPIGDVRVSAEYRREMVVRRAFVASREPDARGRASPAGADGGTRGARIPDAPRVLLRGDLRLTGTNLSCEHGGLRGLQVPAGTGGPWTACLVLALDVEGREVTTIEGLAAARPVGARAPRRSIRSSRDSSRRVARSADGWGTVMAAAACSRPA